MDKTTGILTLNQALDYELHKSYQLKVEVYDNGVNSLSDTCVIYVYVLDQNDHAPSIQMKFNPIFEHNQDGNMAYIKESWDINLPIAFVTVDDQDSGDYGKVCYVFGEKDELESSRRIRDGQSGSGPSGIGTET